MNPLHNNRIQSEIELLPSIFNQSQQSQYTIEFSRNDLQLKIESRNQAKIYPEEQIFKKQLHGAIILKQSIINPEQLDAEYIRKNQIIQEEQKESKGYGLQLRHIYVKRFLRILKGLSGLILFKELKKQHIDLIDDNSVDYNYFMQLGYLKKDKAFNIKNFKNQFNKAIKVLNLSQWHTDLLIKPNQLFSIVWNMFMLILLIININYVFIQYSFQIETNSYVSGLVDDLPNYGLIVDILFNFNTGYYTKGLLILDRKKIVIHYLKKRFISDLIIITVYFVGYLQSIPALQLILILRIYDVYHIYQELESILRIKQRFGNSIELLKLILFILFLANLGACSFHKLAQLEKENGIEVTWLDSTIDQSWFVRYVDSFYFTIVTMSTLGYGDITPKNYIEKIFTIVLVLLSCFIFAFCMNSVGEILKEMGKQESQFKEKMGCLNMYMEQRGVDPLILQRVRKYQEYIFKEEMENNMVAKEMMNKLTKDLKHEVQKDIYGKLLRSQKTFSLYFSSQFIDKLAIKIKENKLPPDEYIFKSGQDSNNLYFVMKGKVRFFNNQKNFENNKNNQMYIKTLEKGQVIGESEFFTGKQRFFSCKTLNVTSLAIIDKKDFMELLKEFPEDFESFNMIKDNLNLYNNSEGIGISCLSCQSFNHQVQKCPLVNVRCNIRKIQYEHRSQIDQNRGNHQRKQSRNPYSLTNIFDIKDAGYQLCVEQNGTFQFSQQYLKKNINDPQIDSFSSSDDDQNEIPRGYQEFKNELKIIEQKMNSQIEKILVRQNSYSQLEEQQVKENVEQNYPFNQMTEKRKSRSSFSVSNLVDVILKKQNSLIIDKQKVSDINLNNPKLFIIDDNKDYEENDSYNEDECNIQIRQNLKPKIKKPLMNVNGISSLSVSDSEISDKNTTQNQNKKIPISQQNQQHQNKRITPQDLSFGCIKKQEEQKDLPLNQQKNETRRNDRWIQKVDRHNQLTKQNDKILKGFHIPWNLYEVVPQALIDVEDKYSIIDQVFENEFEKIKSFNNYFKWNNVEIVLEWFKEIQVKNPNYQKIKIKENIKKLYKNKRIKSKITHKKTQIYLAYKYKNIYKKKQSGNK